MKKNNDPKTVEELVTGIIKGYPDTAIRDFADYTKNNRQREDIVMSHIPHTGNRDEAQPNYNFYPEHEYNSDIQENIKTAGETLQNFYERTNLK